MGQKLLREYYELCEGGVCQDLLTEDEKRFVANGGMILSGKLQEADCQNGNGRIYPHSVLMREMKTYSKLVKEQRALGELDHPDDSVINLRNVSHMITDLWWDNNDVMGKIKILDTPSGRVVKDLINAGVKLGISSRGMGSVQEQMGTSMVQEDFELICFDIVSEPSTPNAYIYPDNRSSTSPSLYETKVNKAKEVIINDLFSKILKD